MDSAAGFGFPVWLCATHFLNILFLTLMARSGLEVLSACPKLYLSDDCQPGREVLRFTKKRFSPSGGWSSLEEEEAWSPWIALPGGKNLGLGRHWHFMTLQFWITTGVVYVLFLIVSGEWPRIVPTSWSIFPQAGQSLLAYLHGRLAPPQSGLPYNGIQQLSYFFVIFVLTPLQIATGAAMSPAIIAQFPWYIRLFGGKQSARTLHFVGLCLFGAFVLIHTAMVFVHGLPTEWAAIALTSYRANHAAAIAVGVFGLVAIFAVNLVITVFSRRCKRETQQLTGTFVNPFENIISRLYVSNQRYSRDDVSPFFRVNGYPPPSAEYEALAVDGFRDYRLEVRGLVEIPLSLSLAQLRTMGYTTQITKHNCIQGWTATAEWGGVPLKKILDRCLPLGVARRMVFYAFDDKTITEDEGRFGMFYGTIPMHLADNPQTMLALDMNGQPLPIEHGAPVRLRVETQLGFKMVKWVRAIEFVEDYHRIGQGQGGWREDQQFYANAAGI